MKKHTYFISNIEGCNFDFDEEGRKKYSPMKFFGPYGRPYIKIRTTWIGALKLRFNIWWLNMRNRRSKSQIHLTKGL